MKEAKVLPKLGLLWILMLCFSTNVAKAQGDEDDEMRNFFGGLSAGANFSQVTGDFMEGWNRIGPNFSGFTYFKIAEQFAGCFEMNYSEKGSRAKKSELPYPNAANTKFYSTAGIKLPYAEIPLTFNYFYKRESHVGAGFAYGRLFNAKESYDTLRTDILYPFRKSDYSFVLNANIRLKQKFYLNMRFNHSLGNIRASKNILMPHRDLQQNKLLCLRLVYMF
jgi:hypothetical protein